MFLSLESHSRAPISLFARPDATTQLSGVFRYHHLSQLPTRLHRADGCSIAKVSKRVWMKHKRILKLHPSNPNFSKKGSRTLHALCCCTAAAATNQMRFGRKSVCAELAQCAPTSPLIKSCQIQEQLGFGALFSAFHRYHHRSLILIVSHLPPPSPPAASLLATSEAHSDLIIELPPSRARQR